MSSDPKAPAHPVRRLVRWIVVALAAAVLLRLILMLAGS
jgi:hypothetical protein